ncbi:MAG TPA: YcnI family protein [Mycobacteriales bacterium]|nr:YcnI family protein [Mycobacteriales bacterium]
MSRLVRRLLVGGGMTALLVGVVAAPASAHVTVHSTDATQGGFGLVTFRVPTESDTASTVELKVQFPTDQPIASVSTQPIPGWTATATTRKLSTPIQSDDGEVTEVVSVVDWKANAPANGIKPGNFQQFTISAGPLPKVDSLQFKAIQTYSDSSQIAWIEQQTPGGAEPEHPAPTLKLAPASSTDGTAAAPAGSAGSGSGGNKATTAAASDGPSKGSVTIALIIAIVGVIVGLAGVGIGFTARRAGGVPAASQREESTVS